MGGVALWLSQSIVVDAGVVETVVEVDVAADVEASVDEDVATEVLGVDVDVAVEEETEVLDEANVVVAEVPSVVVGIVVDNFVVGTVIVGGLAVDGLGIAEGFDEQLEHNSKSNEKINNLTKIFIFLKKNFRVFLKKFIKYIY